MENYIVKKYENDMLVEQAIKKLTVKVMVKENRI